MMKVINLPRAPKCPKGAKCVGSAITQTGAHISDTVYSRTYGIIFTYVEFCCICCRSSVEFVQDARTWRLTRITKR